MHSFLDLLASARSYLSKGGGIAFHDESEDQSFETRLRETICWCHDRADLSQPKSCLRSNALRPEVVDATGVWDYEYKDVAGSVARLNQARATLLGPGVRKAIADSGKLLAYWPYENLDCGAAEVTSTGFFDVRNTPPWDTWFWFGTLKNQPHTLISWVPDKFVQLVEAGIWANPEQCIQWVENF